MQKKLIATATSSLKAAGSAAAAVDQAMKQELPKFAVTPGHVAPKVPVAEANPTPKDPPKDAKAKAEPINPPPAVKK